VWCRCYQAFSFSSSKFWVVQELKREKDWDKMSLFFEKIVVILGYWYVIFVSIRTKWVSILVKLNIESWCGVDHEFKHLDMVV